MKEMAPGVYEVPSDSDYSKTYIVNLTGPFPQCTCTSYAIRKNKAKAQGLPPAGCKHTRQVLSMDPDAFKRAKEQADAAAKQAADEFEAEKQAKADKMKAELLRMRAELHGQKPPLTPKQAAAVEARRERKETADMGVEDVLIAAQMGDPIPDPATIDKLIAKDAPLDLMGQLEAAIEAQKGK